jgi:hypothetical protein
MPGRVYPIGPTGVDLGAEAEYEFSATSALIRRQATRDFQEEPQDVGRLLRSVKAGYSAERTFWPNVVHGDQDFRVLVAAFNIVGHPPGLYLIEEREVLSMRPVDLDFSLEDLLPSNSNAPAVIVVCGRVGSSLDENYGGLLVRAGSFGYAVWFAAVRSGLAGCAYGGSDSLVTRSIRKVYPVHRHLFSVALGSPARERIRSHEWSDHGH